MSLAKASKSSAIEMTNPPSLSVLMGSMAATGLSFSPCTVTVSTPVSTSPVPSPMT